MRTYHNGFEFRKWHRGRRCRKCKQQFEAGPSAEYCATCSTAVLAEGFSQRTNRTPPLTITAPLLRADAHFAEVDYMARDQHGRAMLTRWQLRRHEVRAGAGSTQMVLA